LVPKAIGEMLGHRPEQAALVESVKVARRHGAQQVIVVMVSLLRSSAATASRCGPFNLDRATARNSGPGKSPLPPIDACVMASSGPGRRAARQRGRAERLDRHEVDSAAMVVRSASIGNRLMRRTPDSTGGELAPVCPRCRSRAR